ncbi:MAG: DUF86 domain-containing protein [Candidatus Aenigmarchaeota archaeon]|nr:DUF86 domain-containing protein [Candidatus Aenigmarchaeota archaeon]
MKKEIYIKMKYLKEYVDNLRDMSSCTLQQLKQDKKLRGAVERYLQLSIEIALEVGEMIIAHEGLRKPKKHQEVIEILGEGGILPKAFAKKFAPAGGFRNILVHMYEGIEVVEVYKNLKEISDFDTFAKHIALYLENKEE